jgi:predicted nucleotide-binding protein
LKSARVLNNANTLARNILEGRDWLIKHCNSAGGFSAFPDTAPTALNTCWGCVALQECDAFDAFYEPRIETTILSTAVRMVEETRRPGGWASTLIQTTPDALGTAYSTYFLLKLNSDAARLGLSALRNTQLDDGSWEAGPTDWVVEATAWAMHVWLLEEAKQDRANPTSPRIETAVRYLRNLYFPHRGWPLRPGGEYKPWTAVFVCLALLKYVDALRQLDTPAHEVQPSRSGRKVFVVHGHNPIALQSVKQYLEKLKVEPIILKDQPNLGVQPVFDKFIHYANLDGLDYAVVLGTPDELIDASSGKGVPRMNVVLELGFFVGKLGPERVCLISTANIDFSDLSDLMGVAYIDLDQDDWQERLERQLQQAGVMP